MQAWVLDDPGQLRLTEKPVPQPGPAEVLVRIDAIAFCDGDIRIITKGPPALIQGGLPFNKNFTPGHEYVGRVVELGPGVDEFAIGDRVAVEVHFGCGRCERCRSGMYTSCLNYGMNYGEHNKGHRANGFTTDGGFAEYARQQRQHAGACARQHRRRGSDADRDRRYGDVCARHAWRPDRGTKSRRHRTRCDRAADRRRRQGARRGSGDFDRHARFAIWSSGASSAPII